MDQGLKSAALKCETRYKADSRALLPQTEALRQPGFCGSSSEGITTDAQFLPRLKTTAFSGPCRSSHILSCSPLNSAVNASV